MEIRVLRYFLAVAREENITAAADSLNLTQPTLSRQIRDLEDELGKTLLVRKSHKVELTQDGMRFRKRAEEILEMVDRTTAEFTAADEGISGDIHIGSGETRAIKRLADIIRNLDRTVVVLGSHMLMEYEGVFSRTLSIADGAVRPYEYRPFAFPDFHLSIGESVLEADNLLIERSHRSSDESLKILVIVVRRHVVDKSVHGVSI